MAASRPKSPQPPLRIAVDTGGTFTDCVWVERGKLRMTKVFSTPADPSQAIADALAQVNPTGVVILLHGTTVGTNTLLQRKGARVAFVTTAGFEDTIEIGRQNRPRLYDLTFERVPPLVERNMRFGVPERVAPNGEILQKPSREDLQVLARDVHTSGADSIAVSTLFSFANPENERAIGRVLEELGLPPTTQTASYLGDGHAAWDNGFGYTYFNQTTGLEFTAVSGLTYNFTNPSTDYQNGIDWHTDLEASRFLSKQFFVGGVGYYFNQLTGDTSGSGATLGPYLSRIAAIGPEVGVLFPVGEMQGSLNLRAIGSSRRKTARPAGIRGWCSQ